MSTADRPRTGEVDESDLPPRPERPDCCGGGCATCVLDGYVEDVQRWEAEIAAIRARRRLAAAQHPDSTP